MLLKQSTCATNRTPISFHFKRMFNAGMNNFFRARYTLKFCIHLPQLSI